MNAGSVGPVFQTSADGEAGWLEHETAKACLDPIGQERVWWLWTQHSSSSWIHMSNLTHYLQEHAPRGPGSRSNHEAGPEAFQHILTEHLDPPWEFHLSLASTSRSIHSTNTEHLTCAKSPAGWCWGHSDDQDSPSSVLLQLLSVEETDGQ